MAGEGRGLGHVRRLRTPEELLADEAMQREPMGRCAECDEIAYAQCNCGLFLCPACYATHMIERSDGDDWK